MTDREDKEVRDSVEEARCRMGCAYADGTPRTPQLPCPECGACFDCASDDCGACCVRLDFLQFERGLPQLEGSKLRKGPCVHDAAKAFLEGEAVGT